jgi:hypothetical protein
VARGFFLYAETSDRLKARVLAGIRLLIGRGDIRGVGYIFARWTFPTWRQARHLSVLSVATYQFGGRERVRR